MSTVKFYAMRLVVTAWPVVPVSVKGVIYRAHRRNVARRLAIKECSFEWVD